MEVNGNMADIILSADDESELREGILPGANAVLEGQSQLNGTTTPNANPSSNLEKMANGNLKQPVPLIPGTSNGTVSSPNDVQGNITVGNTKNPKEDQEENGVNQVNGVRGVSPENDDSKRETDTAKAVTFAEDIEVYACKATTPITVSLDTPVHLVDPATFAEKQDDVDKATEAAQIEIDVGYKGYTVQELVPLLSDADTDSSESDHDRKAFAVRPSVLSLFTDAPLSNEDNKTDASPTKSAVESSSRSTEEEPSVQEEAKPGQDIDGGETQVVESEAKQFTVSAVLESELESVPEEGDMVRRGSTSHNVDPLSKSKAETAPLILKTPADSDGSPSQTGLSNYQDTIGPLENPAFLKTLKYSVSQPFDDDEQFGDQSNLDVTSMGGAHLDPDMDGGWAWVVLAAAFLSLMVIGASILLTGVLMKAILEKINPDITKVSWVGSVYVSSMCMTGPLAAIVMKKMGVRCTVCVAGFVMFLGFFGASFSTSVLQLIATHGLVAGVASGFVVNPTFVIVGQYFNRLRGLACGLLAAGAGVGVLAGGAAISILLNTFSLSGAYLIFSAITLHIIASGMLMLPSPEEKIRAAERTFTVKGQQYTITSQQELTSAQNSMMSGLNSMFSSMDQTSVLGGIDRIGHSKWSGLHRNPSKHSSVDIEVPLLKAVLSKETSRSSHSVTTNKSYHRSHSQLKNSLSPGPLEVGSLSTALSPSATPNGNSPYSAGSSRHINSSQHINSSYSLANTHLQSTSTLAQSSITPHYPPSSPTSTRGPSSQGRFHRSRLLSVTSQPHSQYTSLSHISQRLSISGPGHSQIDNASLASTLISHLRPRDALRPRYTLGSRSISTFMGSMASFPTSLAIVADDVTRAEGFDGSEHHTKSMKGHVIGVLDSMRILRNKPFLVFLSTCFVWAFGEAPVMMYLPSYAMSKGTSEMQASSLFTALGIGSICGRFLVGLIATDKNIGPIVLHMGCLGMSGILIAMSPLITATVVEQMAFSALLGVYTGGLVPLMALMTIELLGLSELSIGFGFLCLAQSFGYLLGPPLSGVIVSTIGYDKSFVFSGCAFLCGSLLTLLIPIVLNSSDDDDDDQNYLEALERALEENSDSECEDDINDEDMDSVSQRSKNLEARGREVDQSDKPREENGIKIDVPEENNILIDTEDKLETIVEVT